LKQGTSRKTCADREWTGDKLEATIPCINNLLEMVIGDGFYLERYQNKKYIYIFKKIIFNISMI
jgi:hypothetical protein